MPAYYNEIDPFAANWLRQLIASDSIAPGDVDERSIADVTPADLRGYSQCHFFAGVGVWSYALREAGWPDDKPVWTGSCPCQPFSRIGENEGFEDERHLWPELHRLIRQCHPPICFGEQVAQEAGLIWFDTIQADLVKADYACGMVVFPACSVGAPHKRERLYWLAERLVSEWRRVVFADECIYNAWDTDREQGICPVCEGEYGGWGCERECDCPGPTEDGWEYEDAPREDGHLYARRMVHPVSEGLEGYSRNGHAVGGSRWKRKKQSRPVAKSCGTNNRGPTNGFWREVDWMQCEDGRWRPVEPGTQPLAYGSSSRVGALRGYGNAIVAQQAQAFIETYQDIVE